MGRLYVRQAAPSINITECASVPLFIPTDPPTTPPYTLIVYSQIPKLYPLTVEHGTAYWTVVYSAATTLVYSIVDSEGKSVGNPTRANVQATSGSTACLPPQSNNTNRLELWSDITRDFDMCSPLNIRIDGGQKPYTVTMVPVGVAPAFNISLGENDDSLYWVNVLQPNTTLVVAASDSKGLYGFSDTFGTTGNRVVSTCSGQVTHSFNSRDPLGQKGNTTSITTAPNSSSSTNNSGNGINANSQNDGGRTTAIVGGTLGAIILLLGLLFILFRRRKRRAGFLDKHDPAIDFIPEPVPYFDSAPGGSINQTGVPSTSFGHSYNAQPTSSFGHNGVAGIGMNATNRKAARPTQEWSATQEGRVSPLTSTDHSSGVQVRQHTDAMAIIELPPAYRDAPSHNVSSSK